MLVCKIKFDGVLTLSKYKLLSCNKDQVPIILSSSSILTFLFLKVQVDETKQRGR